MEAVSTPMTLQESDLKVGRGWSESARCQMSPPIIRLKIIHQQDRKIATHRGDYAHVPCFAFPPAD